MRVAAPGAPPRGEAPTTVPVYLMGTRVICGSCAARERIARAYHRPFAPGVGIRCDTCRRPIEPPAVPNGHGHHSPERHRREERAALHTTGRGRPSVEATS